MQHSRISKDVMNGRDIWTCLGTGRQSIDNAYTDKPQSVCLSLIDKNPSLVSNEATNCSIKENISLLHASPRKMMTNKFCRQLRLKITLSRSMSQFNFLRPFFLCLFHFFSASLCLSLCLSLSRSVSLSLSLSPHNYFSLTLSIPFLSFSFSLPPSNLFLCFYPLLSFSLLLSLDIWAAEQGSWGRRLTALISC